ncbi:MAG: hypothetical protein ACI9U0_001304 [Flavobacteriales bacterium]|jgi:hypothetical protein
MKKILLSAALLAGVVANAQNPTTLMEEMDGVTPCFLGYEDGAGAFQGSPGHDFTNMQWDETNGTMTFDATTHATLHGPLYYTLSGGDLDECLAAEGLVDISANNLLAIRAKASEPLNITAYTQEGNAASWNYSKFSETTLQMSLTTEFQEFSVADISALSTNGTDAVDLTSIGTIAFELANAAFDGGYDDVSGALVTIDFIRLGEAATSVNETVVTGFNVYPNPATDALNVKFDANAVTTVELTDLTGKIVATNIAQAGASTVNFATANVNAGVYFVNVKNVNGSTTQKVVIK